MYAKCAVKNAEFEVSGVYINGVFKGMSICSITEALKHTKNYIRKIRVDILRILFVYIVSYNFIKTKFIFYVLSQFVTLTYLNIFNIFHSYKQPESK